MHSQVNRRAHLDLKTGFDGDRELVDQLRSHADHNTTLIVMVANMGHFNLTLNCIESIRRQGRLDNLFMFCLSRNLCDRLAALGVNSAMIPLSWLDEDLRAVMQSGALDDESTWGKKEYFKITFFKQVVVLRLLVHGFSVLFTDTDIVWVKEKTLDYFLGATAHNPDLVFMASLEGDEPRFLWPYVNSGFYFVRPTPLTQKLFELAVWNQARISDFSQNTFNMVMDVLGMKPNGPNSQRVQFLSKVLFVNGHDYFFEKTPQSMGVIPYTVHANYLIGKEKKEGALKEAGLWFLGN